ncbi:MAG: hypothetical protein GY854_30230 [Deltaproteobacteria bacterium]|nr:hypothetical protein [Deltaproteobacteria bacterium]
MDIFDEIKVIAERNSALSKIADIEPGVAKALEETTVVLLNVGVMLMAAISPTGAREQILALGDPVN